MQLAALLPFQAIFSHGLASPMKRTTEFEVQDLCATLYSNNILGTLQFTVQSPNTNLGDSCCISWQVVDQRQHHPFAAFSPHITDMIEGNGDYQRCKPNTLLCT